MNQPWVSNKSKVKVKIKQHIKHNKGKKKRRRKSHGPNSELQSVQSQSQKPASTPNSTPSSASIPVASFEVLLPIPTRRSVFITDPNSHPNIHPSLVHISAPTLVVPINRAALRGEGRVVGLFAAAAYPTRATILVSSGPARCIWQRVLVSPPSGKRS